jgi:osmotically-inducible protein OsmY
MGTIGSWQALRVARDAAAATPGVRAVRISLHVDPGQARTDENVRAEVQSRLRGDLRIDARLVRVVVHDGAVELFGHVGDARERAIAEEDAWEAGVRSVRERLHLLFEGTPRASVWRGPVSDDEIRAAALDAFVQDWRLTGASPAVAVRGGVVELQGTVLDAFARDAAEADAANAGRSQHAARSRRRRQPRRGS